MILLVRTGYEILANGLVMISAFVPFFAIKELGRVLGREKFRALFFRRRAATGSGLLMNIGTEQSRQK